MADVDLYGVGDGASRHSVCNHESQTLLAWDRDIVRAARFRARGRRNPDYVSDELAQAARLRVLSALRKHGQVPIAYLRTVVSNAVATPIASDRALDSASEIEEGSAVDTGLDQADPLAVDAVRTWLSSLPEQLQRVYRLLFVEEYSQREAALIVGVSQPRIAQLHRALLERGAADLQRFAA